MQLENDNRGPGLWKLNNSLLEDEIYGLNNDRKNQRSSAIVKKLDFTLLFAKYYLYINKLAPKDLSLDEFKAKISWRYDFEKPPPSIR